MRWQTILKKINPDFLLSALDLKGWRGCCSIESGLTFNLIFRVKKVFVGVTREHFVMILYRMCGDFCLKKPSKVEGKSCHLDTLYQSLKVIKFLRGSGVYIAVVPSCLFPPGELYVTPRRTCWAQCTPWHKTTVVRERCNGRCTVAGFIKHDPFFITSQTKQISMQVANNF